MFKFKIKKLMHALFDFEHLQRVNLKKLRYNFLLASPAGPALYLQGKRKGRDLEKRKRRGRGWKGWENGPARCL
jgi:hypothetical protein